VRQALPCTFGTQANHSTFKLSRYTNFNFPASTADRHCTTPLGLLDLVVKLKQKANNFRMNNGLPHHLPYEQRRPINIGYGMAAAYTMALTLLSVMVTLLLVSLMGDLPDSCHSILIGSSRNPRSTTPKSVDLLRDMEERPFEYMNDEQLKRHGQLLRLQQHQRNQLAEEILRGILHNIERDAEATAKLRMTTPSPMLPPPVASPLISAPTATSPDSNRQNSSGGNTDFFSVTPIVRRSAEISIPRPENASSNLETDADYDYYDSANGESSHNSRFEEVEEYELIEETYTVIEGISLDGRPAFDFSEQWKPPVIPATTLTVEFDESIQPRIPVYPPITYRVPEWQPPPDYAEFREWQKQQVLHPHKEE
jgi:hypothetical protein